jgi:hypothetical protein
VVATLFLDAGEVILVNGGCVKTFGVPKMVFMCCDRSIELPKSLVVDDNVPVERVNGLGDDAFGPLEDDSC